MHGLAQRKWIYYTVCGWSSRSQNAVCYVHCIYSAIHVLMTDEKEEERSKQGQRRSNTAHPRQSLFLKKNELPRVGLEPTTLYTLDRALYHSTRALAGPKSHIS